MAKAHKQSNKNKLVRANKRGSAKEAIGVIDKNTDTFCLTYGQFSLIDALMVVVDQTGPAHVVISTWTAAHAHLEKSAQLMETADILSLRMIVDRSFKTRQPKYYHHMLELFGANSVREIRTHAKFITVRNDEWDIVVRTSMNLNENPRLENIEISENKAFADFFEQIVEDVFNEVEQGETKSDIPELANIEEFNKFPLIRAKHIKRRNLNEPRFSHELGQDQESTRASQAANARNNR